MEINNMKNIVVLKDLPSNMIEEAFVILKSNVKIHNRQAVEQKEKKLEDVKSHKSKKNNKEVSNNYIVTEAQMIIKEYAQTLEVGKEAYKKKELEQRCKRLQAATTFFASFSFLMLLKFVLSLF